MASLHDVTMAIWETAAATRAPSHHHVGAPVAKRPAAARTNKPPLATLGPRLGRLVPATGRPAPGRRAPLEGRGRARGSHGAVPSPGLMAPRSSRCPSANAESETGCRGPRACKKWLCPGPNHGPSILRACASGQSRTSAPQSLSRSPIHAEDRLEQEESTGAFRGAMVTTEPDRDTPADVGPSALFVRPLPWNGAGEATGAVPAPLPWHTSG